MCCYMLSYATMLCNLCPYILKYVILCGLSKYGMCQVYFNGFESEQDNILPQLGIEPYFHGPIELCYQANCCLQVNI